MQEVIRGAAVALLLKVLGAGATVLFTVMIARLFGAEGMGLYSLAFTVMTIATVFGRLGMDNTLLRFVAAGAASGDWGVVKGVYRKGLGFSFLASVTATLVVVALAPFLGAYAFHNAALTPAIRWMALAIIPMTASTLLASTLQGLKRIFSSMFVVAVAVPSVAAVALAVLGRQAGAVSSVWAYTVGAVVTAVGAWWWWHRSTPQLAAVGGSFDTRVLFESSMPLLWTASMSMAMNWIATFALGIWSTTSDVGIFNAASRVTYLVSFVLVAVNTISAPKFAALHAAGEFKALATTARASEHLMVLLAAPVLLICLIGARPIMGVFGTAFRTGWLQLAILAVGQAANVMTGSVGYLLMMSGHERQVRDSNTVAAVTCLLGAIVLVPHFGGVGASVAVALALIARNIVEVAQVRRYLGIGILFLPPPAFEVERYGE